MDLISLFYSPYTLIPRQRGFLTERSGCLFKVLFSSGEEGFADFCPFEPWGHPSWQSQLRAVEQGDCPPLFRRALIFAARDATARASQRSLFPASWTSHHHAFLPLSEAEAALEKALTEGFSRFKLKIRPSFSFEALRPLLVRLQNISSDPTPKIRLDFHQSFSEPQWLEYSRKLIPFLPWIEWVEDPFPFFPSQWSTLSRDWVPWIALDESGSCQTSLAAPRPFSTLVLKPAFQPWKTLAHRALRASPPLSICVTSALDHPLGQATAAWALSDLENSGLLCPGLTHGLLSHSFYQPHPFSEAFEETVLPGGELRSPSGTGFGFDSLLKTLPFQPLLSLKGKTL